jgi:hypothetical protein
LLIGRALDVNRTVETPFDGGAENDSSAKPARQVQNSVDWYGPASVGGCTPMRWSNASAVGTGSGIGMDACIAPAASTALKMRVWF